VTKYGVNYNYFENQIAGVEQLATLGIKLRKNYQKNRKWGWKMPTLRIIDLIKMVKVEFCGRRAIRKLKLLQKQKALNAAPNFQP